MEQKSKACLVKLGVRTAKALASGMSDITATDNRFDVQDQQHTTNQLVVVDSRLCRRILGVWSFTQVSWWRAPCMSP